MEAKAEVRSQRSGVRGQESEVRGQFGQSQHTHARYNFGNRERKPICLRSRRGGDISCRIASNTTLNCRSCLLSKSSSRRASSTFDASICLRRTNVRMISMLTTTARLLRNTLDNIATPCSVKAVTRLENFRFEDVTNCDIPVISSRVSSNMKSDGNRSRLRPTA